jgi:hypothetical protein
MNKLFDLCTYAFIVAGILVLTRPGSQGPAFLQAAGGALENLVRGASGQPHVKV